MFEYRAVRSRHYHAGLFIQGRSLTDSNGNESTKGCPSSRWSPKVGVSERPASRSRARIESDPKSTLHTNGGGVTHLRGPLAARVCCVKQTPIVRPCELRDIDSSVMLGVASGCSWHFPPLPSAMLRHPVILCTPLLFIRYFNEELCGARQSASKYLRAEKKGRIYKG